MLGAVELAIDVPGAGGGVGAADPARRIGAAPLEYPLPLEPAPQAELVLPTDEGVLLPVTAIDLPKVLGVYQYRHGGFLMPWFGLIEGQRGIMALVETPDDLTFNVRQGGCAWRGKVATPRSTVTGGGLASVAQLTPL